jgi:hypothetical protein
MAAIQKRYLKEVDTAGSYDAVQAAINSSSTDVNIEPFGFTPINAATTESGTTGTVDVVLGDPGGAGVRKSIAVTLGSTKSVTLVMATTTTTFFGSNNDTVVFSTGAGEKFIQLVATSTSEWAVVGASTGLTYST